MGRQSGMDHLRILPYRNEDAIVKSLRKTLGTLQDCLDGIVLKNEDASDLSGSLGARQHLELTDERAKFLMSAPAMHLESLLLSLLGGRCPCALGIGRRLCALVKVLYRVCDLGGLDGPAPGNVNFAVGIRDDTKSHWMLVNRHGQIIDHFCDLRTAKTGC